MKVRRHRRRECTLASQAIGLALALSVLPCAEAGFNDGIVAYRDLGDKGLTREQILKKTTGFRPFRTPPPVRYLAQGPNPATKGNVDFESIPVTLDGTSQGFTFGLPFAQGALFDLGKIRLRHPESKSEIPIQADALALWPDGSIKSALLQSLPAHDQSLKSLTVEFGNTVQRDASVSARLSFEETESEFLVETGKLQVRLSRTEFTPFANLSVDRDSNGVYDEAEKLTSSRPALELADEAGKIYTASKLQSFTVERSGPVDLVLRAEGKYLAEDGSSLMRYVARLRFAAGQSRIEWTVTHINDEVAQEFTDIRSLTAAVGAASSGQGTLALEKGVAKPKKNGTLSQWSDSSFELTLDGASSTIRGRAPGAAEITAESSGQFVGLRDFWQRWPKSLSTHPEGFSLGLLPAQPSKTFGKDLPFHLMFPFVEGCYRMKWGMAFTERIVVDFSSSETINDFAAHLDETPRAVLPAEYISKTGVFGNAGILAASLQKEYSDYMQASMALHESQREKQREYGFFNWGDWFGERSRNWGNNEYDRAHGFFTYHLVSGDSRFFEDALDAARHQADVDIIHAYPDPYYVGANHQHSIGHTGVWSERVKPAVWSYAYDGHTSAGNGHTWTDGMADAWLLTGDPVVMESLIALGEHIAFAFAPSFSKVGSHERSAGWSLRAAMGAYRATSDPAYLEAARTIAKVPMSQWDEENGIKAHILPADHASGNKGIVGNSVYNIGILLMGLAELHRETNDPQVLAYMKAGAEWLVKSWNSAALAWPYSCDADGKAITPLAPNLNSLLYPSLAYIGLRTSDPTMLRIARDACVATFLPGSRDVLAKEFSIKAYASTEALGALAQAEVKGLLPTSVDHQEVFTAVTIPSDLSFRDATPLSLIVAAGNPESEIRLEKIATANSVPADATFKIATPSGDILQTFQIPASAKSWSGTWQQANPDQMEARLITSGESNEALRLRVTNSSISLPSNQSILLRDRGLRRWELELQGQAPATLELDGIGAGAYFIAEEERIPETKAGRVSRFQIPSGEDWKDRPRKLSIIAWNNELLRITLTSSSPASLRLLSNAPPE